MNDRISITVENHVADVRLTRADKMNALDPAMFAGIIAAGEELAGMKAVRAVVLSGPQKRLKPLSRLNLTPSCPPATFLPSTPSW